MAERVEDLPIGCVGAELADHGRLALLASHRLHQLLYEAFLLIDFFFLSLLFLEFLYYFLILLRLRQIPTLFKGLDEELTKRATGSALQQMEIEILEDPVIDQEDHDVLLQNGL